MNDNKFTYLNWPDKKFGMWREYGDGCSEYPSALDFVNAERNSAYDKQRLINYLNNGMAYVCTSRMNFPSPFDGEIVGGAICWRTDGVWEWFDNISDFIEQNNMVIPEAFYNHICSNNFTLPETIEPKFDIPGFQD